MASTLHTVTCVCLRESGRSDVLAIFKKPHGTGQIRDRSIPFEWVGTSRGEEEKAFSGSVVAFKSILLRFIYGLCILD